MGIFLFESMRLAMQSTDLACKQCQMMMAASMAMLGTQGKASERCKKSAAELSAAVPHENKTPG